jgi:hypothetical protein
LPASASIDAHSATITGKGASLADNPQYSAAVGAVTQPGTLIQAMVIDGKYLLNLGSVDSLLGAFLKNPKTTKETLVQILEKDLETYQTLPPYELILLADVVTESEQVGLMALVYSNADDAQKAAEILPARIKAYTSQGMARPLTDLLKERHVDRVQTQIVDDAATKKTVLLLKFATPKATTEQKLVFGDLKSATESKVTAPGIVFRMLSNMLFQADANWLSTVPRETLQQQLATLKK